MSGHTNQSNPSFNYNSSLAIPDVTPMEYSLEGMDVNGSFQGSGGLTSNPGVSAVDATFDPKKWLSGGGSTYNNWQKFSLGMNGITSLAGVYNAYQGNKINRDAQRTNARVADANIANSAFDREQNALARARSNVQSGQGIDPRSEGFDAAVAEYRQRTEG